MSDHRPQASHLTHLLLAALGLLTLGLTAPLLAAQGAPGEEGASTRFAPMPERRTPENGPDWVSAGMVAESLVEDGDSEVLSERLRESLARLATKPDDGKCTQGGDIVRPMAGKGGPDFPTTLRSTGYAAFTTVTGVAQGFAHTFAGTLYRVTVDEVLVGQPTIGLEYFFFLPVADFRLNGRRICIQASAYPSRLPETGDQLLLLTDGAPAFDWLSVRGSTDVVVLHGGEVYLSRHFRLAHKEWEKGTAEGFRAWIRGLAKESAR